MFHLNFEKYFSFEVGMLEDVVKVNDVILWRFFNKLVQCAKIFQLFFKFGIT